MSRFPNPESFKRDKTNVQNYIENFTCGDFLYNIVPRKTKQAYIYDIRGQKFVDFYLDKGRFVFGYSDKFLTKVFKNHVNKIFLSSTQGIYSYRLIRELLKIFDNIKSVSSFLSLDRVFSYLNELCKCDYILTNSFYLSEKFKNIRYGNFDQMRDYIGKDVVFIVEPFDEIFKPVEIPDWLANQRSILFMGRSGFRFESLDESLKNFREVIFGFGNNYNVFLSSDFIKTVWEFSELQSVECYYSLLRLRFLVKERLSKIRKKYSKYLRKLSDLGIIDSFSDFGFRISSEKFFEGLNQKLLENGILSVSNKFYFSFSHVEHDFRRLYRFLKRIL